MSLFLLLGCEMEENWKAGCGIACGHWEAGSGHFNGTMRELLICAGHRM